jgi:hypothetical protein
MILTQVVIGILDLWNASTYLSISQKNFTKSSNSTYRPHQPIVRKIRYYFYEKKIIFNKHLFRCLNDIKLTSSTARIKAVILIFITKLARLACRTDTYITTLVRICFAFFVCCASIIRTNCGNQITAIS